VHSAADLEVLVTCFPGVESAQKLLPARGLPPLPRGQTCTGRRRHGEYGV